MNNTSNINNVDKVYLALELTKLMYSNTQNNVSSSIYDTFDYFLKNLNDIDDIIIIDEYKKEIENLEKQNKMLHEENQRLRQPDAYLKNSLNLIKEYIINNGGNMEPEVKVQLLKLLDNIFD